MSTCRFRTPSNSPRKRFDKVLGTLRNKRQHPVMLHCGSADRVGAIWYAYRVLDSKLKPDKALKESEQVGLRTHGYLEKAREYVDHVKNSSRKP